MTKKVPFWQVEALINKKSRAMSAGYISLSIYDGTL